MALGSFKENKTKKTKHIDFKLDGIDVQYYPDSFDVEGDDILCAKSMRMGTHGKNTTRLHYITKNHEHSSSEGDVFDVITEEIDLKGNTGEPESFHQNTRKMKFLPPPILGIENAKESLLNEWKDFCENNDFGQKQYMSFKG